MNDARSKTRVHTIMITNPYINSISDLDIKLSCLHGGLNTNRDKSFVLFMGELFKSQRVKCGTLPHPTFADYPL